MTDCSTRSACAARSVRPGWLAGLAGLAWLAATAAVAQAPRETAVLELGHGVERSHAAGTEHTYTATLTAPGPYLLEVQQRGLDLIVTVEGPGRPARSYNSPLARNEPELAVLEQPGTYTITVRSEEHTGARGGHAVALSALSSDADERMAMRSMARGGQANFGADEAGWVEALEAYRDAAARWTALGRNRERAQALLATATIEFWQLYDWDESAALARHAAELYADSGEGSLRASALHLEAMALVEKALVATQAAGTDSSESAELFAAAFGLLGEARAVFSELGNAYELGRVVNILGYAEHSRGDLVAARAYYEEAAALLEGADEWTAELDPLSNLAVLDTEAGIISASIDTFERIVEILPPGQYQRTRADALYNVGATHRLYGNIEQALQAFSAALETQAEIDDLQGRGRSLRGIGETYYVIGDLELAAQYLEQALPIARQTKDGVQQEGILRLLGNIAFLSGDYAVALERHDEALETATSIVDRAYLELLIARDHLAAGDVARAREIAARAHAAATGADSEMLLASALHELGRIEALAGVGEGFAKLEQAADIYAGFGLQAQRAEVLHSLALAAARERSFDRAIGYGEASIAELEKLRVRMADPELRAFLSASRRDYYETQVGLLMQLGSTLDGEAASEHVRAAFLVSERSRARMTADLLQEAAVDLRYDAGPDLEARRAELYADLAEHTRQRDVLLRQDLEGSEARAALDPILAALASIENELNLLDIELRRTSPRFATLSAPRPLPLDEVQAALDADSVLLQYALGDDASYVWAVTRDAIVAERLADRATIEAAAREAFGQLSAYVPGAGTDAAARELAALSELVLAPVAGHLDRRRIVVALDGALQYVPFAALPVGRPSAPLLESHEVVDVLSMSTLEAQRSRERGARPEKTLAVFADPVFQPTDGRFGDPGGSAAGRIRPESGAFGLTEAGALERLPSSGAEAEAIAALLEPGARLVASGFDASRERVLGADLGAYRFVHFATHGLVDSRYPGLSALALSAFDERMMPRNSLLRLDDIYNLELNADLVVLSACETALGREIRGEGFVGLTQGFMYAGARSIVASLWQVPERATAELMTRFYGFMLTEGLAPANALREAQLSIAQERRWGNPYFWSGFVIVGDWL